MAASETLESSGGSMAGECRDTLGCPVRVLLQTQIEDHKRAHEREHALLEESRIESRDEMKRRLNSMNEFREQLERAESAFVSRQEWNSAHEALIARIDATNTVADTRFRSLERLVYIGVGASGIIGMAIHFIK